MPRGGERGGHPHTKWGARAPGGAGRALDRRKKERNRSPKGNMWSAIPVALLCLVVNRNERQGSGPEGDEVL